MYYSVLKYTIWQVLATIKPLFSKCLSRLKTLPWVQKVLLCLYPVNSCHHPSVLIFFIMYYFFCSTSSYTETVFYTLLCMKFLSLKHQNITGMFFQFMLFSISVIYLSLLLNNFPLYENISLFILMLVDT